MQAGLTNDQLSFGVKLYGFKKKKNLTVLVEIVLVFKD